MTTAGSVVPNETTVAASVRATALADRLEQGARALAAFAAGLTDAQWRMRTPDGRKVGVIFHHVAFMYPIEIQVAQAAAAGQAIDVTWDAVDGINAKHATDFDGVTKAEALDRLRRNSEAAAAAIRALTDAQLDTAVTVALNAGAPLTCQFVLEDHAVRHSYHHLARLRRALTS